MNTNLILHCYGVNSYKVYYENGVYIGDFLVGDDGFYYWWPEFKSGCLDEGFLLDVYNNLKELNKEWDAQIQQYFTEIYKESKPKDIFI